MYNCLFLKSTRRSSLLSWLEMFNVQEKKRIQHKKEGVSAFSAEAATFPFQLISVAGAMQKIIFLKGPKETQNICTKKLIFCIIKF